VRFSNQHLNRVIGHDAADSELADDSYLLSALLEHTTDSIYFKDLESRFVRINRTHACSIGVSNPSEAIGKTDRDFFAEEHAGDARNDEIKIIQTGLPLIGKEEREVRPDGSVTWACTSKMPLFNAAGEVIGTFGVSRDITSRRQNQQALLESETMFRDLTSAIREVFWILDVQNNKTLYASPAYEEIWGRPRAQLYADARDWLCAVHQDDLARVEEQYSGKHNQAFEVTYRIIRPDGTVRWIRGRGFPIFGEDGAVLRLAGIAADITEPRQAHQSLIKTQRLLASIVNSSDDAIISQSLDRTVTSWNPAAERIFGYTAEEAIGSSEGILFRDDQHAETSWISERVRQGVGVENFKTERRHKDGSVVAVSLTVTPVRDETGEIIGASSRAHNISERKKLEDQLSVVSEQLRAVLETTNEYVISLDHEWHITYQNRRRDGADLGTVVGQNFWEREPALLGTSFERESRRAMIERVPCRFEEYIGPMKAWMSGVAYPTGTGLLILVQDDTEKHALDDQLRSAQKMEAIGQLAAGIAHEINTPIQYVGDNTNFLKDSWGLLVSLLAAAQRLRDEVPPGTVPQATIDSFDQCSKIADIDYLSQDIPRAIDQTLEGVQRVARIVSAMKEFSHPGALEKHAIDLNRAIETTVTISRNEWKYVAEVKTQLDPNLPLVPCLAGEINQVLLNLLVNAAHAIADASHQGVGGPGTITLSTRRDGDCVEISVADTGTGIPEHVRERVFDPFFTTKEVGKGTGQGLMLAHTVVVKKHGGKIWFDTEVGKGTTFFVRLPLAVAVEN
jgi:PAS domain S-box-containing protein